MIHAIADSIDETKEAYILWKYQIVQNTYLYSSDLSFYHLEFINKLTDSYTTQSFFRKWITNYTKDNKETPTPWFCDAAYTTRCLT